MQSIINLFKPEGWFVTKFSKITPVSWIIVGVLIVITILAITFMVTNKSQKFTTKMLVTGAMCLAVAFILSYIRIVDLPQGGSVTVISLLPLIIFSYIYGVYPGLIVSFSYAWLQVLQGPYIVHPIQFILDYILAFTLVGLAGLSKKNIVFSAVIAYIARYICHVLSGYFFYAEYAAGAGFDSAILYSLFYNSFCILEMVLCIIVLLLPPVRNMIKKLKMENSKQLT